MCVRYEGGIHPKHRLMPYHAFCTSRIQPGQKVLDIECGYGAVARSLAEAGAVVTGLDMDPEKIRRARETFLRERLTFSQADVPRHHFTEYTPDSFKTELSEAGLRLTPFEINRGEIWAEAVPSRA